MDNRRNASAAEKSTVLSSSSFSGWRANIHGLHCSRYWFVRRTNQYLEQNKPWVLANQPEKEKELDTVLFSAVEALRLLSIYLAPFIPDAADRIRSQLGLEPVKPSAWVHEADWGSVPLRKVEPGPLLFPRIQGS